MKSKINIMLFSFVFIALIFCNKTKAQSTQSLLYGKLTTVQGNTYQGVIRWGSEEAIWLNVFNAVKIRNSYNKYLRSSHRHFTNHYFNCYFGDIKSIEKVNHYKVTIGIKKDNKYIQVNNSSNDIGTDIWICDNEIGHMKIGWRNFKKVEFMDTPINLECKFGYPIWGTVRTYSNNLYTGFITWDKDERLSTDKLDGQTEDGEVSIQFKNIKKIAKNFGSCKVVLNSGREMKVKNSNDVDYRNKGIVIDIPDMGRVELDWKEFRAVEFDNDHKSKATYTSFKSPSRIWGNVKTHSGEEYRGIVIYDIDESMNFEHLDGETYEAEYNIPFRNIKAIRPLDYNHMEIQLKNGKIVTLGNSQDTSNKNDGILIFMSKEDYIYVPIKKVSEIILE